MTPPPQTHGKEASVEELEKLASRIGFDIELAAIGNRVGQVGNAIILAALTTAVSQKDAEIEKLEADCVAMRANIMLWSARFQKYQSWLANDVPPKACIKAVMEDYEELSRLSEPAIACKSGQPILDQLTAANAKITELEQLLSGKVTSHPANSIPPG